VTGPILSAKRYDNKKCFGTLAERVAREFVKRLGRPPRWVAVAPGWVNWIGEHTDYNDGFVPPMAIDRHTVIAGDRNTERQAAVRSITTAAQSS